MNHDRDRAVPAPMEGHGAYSHNSQVQAAGLSPGLPLVAHAAETVALAAGPEPIVIVDYGCSEGRNSLGPIATAIKAMRARVDRQRAICVVHNDLPQNDFTTLFQTLASDPQSYLRENPAVFPYAVGRSFYEQVVPSESVTLGWTSWSVQWLSCVPAPIPDQLQIAFSRDAAAGTAYARQAAQDWAGFVSLRERELRSGGRLVVVTMACDENGDFGYDAQLAAMYGALTELVDEGLVQPKEQQKMAIPTYGRTRDEFLAPFGPAGGVHGMSVERLDIFSGEDRIWEDFQRDGNAQQFGARWAAFSRSSVFPTLATALDCAPNDPRAQTFISRMESGMAARLATAPGPTNIPLASLEIVKV